MLQKLMGASLKLSETNLGVNDRSFLRIWAASEGRGTLGLKNSSGLILKMYWRTTHGIILVMLNDILDAGKSVLK